MPNRHAPHSSAPADDRGFSLVELLIVIVVLGILSTVVVVAVRGTKDDAEDSTCRQHKRVVATAIESYFAQNATSVLPALGAVDGEEYERGLVDADMMANVSVYYEIQADGSLVPEAGSPCT